MTGMFSVRVVRVRWCKSRVRFSHYKIKVKIISQIILSHYICAMQYETMTARQAVIHFSKNKYQGILPVLKDLDKKEYNRVRKVVHDAVIGRISDKRAKMLLEKYGGDTYRVAVNFEVAVGEATQ